MAGIGSGRGARRLAVAVIPALLAAGLLASCAGGPRPNSMATAEMEFPRLGASPPPRRGSAGGRTPTARFVDVTPFTKFASGTVGDAAGGEGGDFADAYTRLVITSTVDSDQKTAADEVEPLAYRPRPWLARYFFGKEFSLNLTAQVTAGAFKATVPLVTIDHVSNAEVGEQWTRMVHHAGAEFPLFLVGSDGTASTPTIVAEFKGAMTGKSRASGEAVKIILGVAKDISPQAGIVTTLSKGAIQKQAEDIDDAISKLYGQGIRESHATDTDLRYWRPGEGVDISLSIPASENGFDSAGALGVGTWTITFESPRPSLFVDWRICRPAVLADGGDGAAPGGPAPRCASDRGAAMAAVYRDVDAANVLVKPLDANANGLGKLGDYLSQQDWYKSAVADLADRTKANRAAGEFCLHMEKAILGLGLTTTDAGIVVWAVSTAMPSIPNRDALASNTTCRRWIDPIEAARR